MRISISVRYLAISAFAVLAFPTSALAQRVGQGAEDSVSIIRVIAALIICLAVAFLAILLVRARRGGQSLPRLFNRLSASTSQIAILETRRISIHAEVCRLQYGGEEYLVLIGQSHSRVLSRLSAAARAEVGRS